MELPQALHRPHDVLTAESIENENNDSVDQAVLRHVVAPGARRILSCSVELREGSIHPTERIITVAGGTVVALGSKASLGDRRKGSRSRSAGGESRSMHPPQPAGVDHHVLERATERLACCWATSDV
ncbi:MAG TPA: hypothetical protein VNN79_21160 [Actinomycetota bacterium]|nr:hypothetical protein [Actinomycetota bacterium]